MSYKMTAKDLKEAGIAFKNPPNSKYPVEKRLEAVTLYMACGNMRQVEAVTGISYSNLRLWQTQDWWKEMEVQIKAGRRNSTATKLNKIVDKALKLVEDRVDNGDWRYNKTSEEFERVPLSALTATKIANDLLQRGDALEKQGQTDTVVQNQQTIQETLKVLALEFASFNKARTVNNPVEEVEDAVYEERKTGLQEGSGAVHEQAGSSEEADGAECSESGDGEGWESSQG